jgi:hypothetical protein
MDFFLYLKKFFTEYDDSLTHTLNIDPLGMTVIWSAFGQKIFNNRVSSISNDVRNYTLNLVHHLAIKELIDSGITLHGQLAHIYPQADILEFKQACLIHSENLFVYSVLTSKKPVDTFGILGASKGRAKLGKGEGISLNFSHTKVSHLLVRQLTLGVSGRYKTPFIDMKFFDKDYRYKHPKYVEQWNKTSKFINSCEELKKVKDLLIAHFKKLLRSTHKNPAINFDEVTLELKAAYQTAFNSAKHVGFMSKDFWLDVSELNVGAAGCLYEVIQASDEQVNRQQVFEQALTLSSTPEVKHKLQNIIDIEPFLAECDLLFTLLMSQRKQTIQDVFKSYKLLGRDINTLPVLAGALVGNLQVQNVLGSTAKVRFESLLKLSMIAQGDDEDILKSIISVLLKYHESIMSKRGQSVWVENDANGNFSCNVKLSKLPSIDKRPTATWYHRYYLSEFKQLIHGLEGQKEIKDVEADAA